MKKKMYGVLLVVVFLIGAYILATFSATSKGTSYSSVKEFKIKEANQFYNLYLPYSYFDENVKKETVEELNKIKIYCQGSDSYNMSFQEVGENKDISITYFISNEDNMNQEELKDYTLVDRDEYNIFYKMDDSTISVIYNSDTKKKIDIVVQYNGNNKDELKDKMIKLMIESIDLNK